jgi:hypothetical protein
VGTFGPRLNDAGRFVETSLRALTAHAHGVAVDTHIVIPDHVHAIIVLGTNPHVAPTISIPELVRAFKLRVMKSWPTGVLQRGWEPYDTHL